LEKPGRKPKNHSLYKKRKLSSEARIIKALREKQPQSFNELLQSSNVSKSQLYNVLPIMVESGLLKCIGKSYALWVFEDLEKIVEESLMRLMEEKYSITIENLTNDVGKPWKDIESVTYALLKRHELKIEYLNNVLFIRRAKPIDAFKGTFGPLR